MSETLNDENAAGNDDVSERRAVEHRALEQCDVVHHGVVSGCPVNSCAAVLNEVMSQTGWNAYELAQRTGLDRSAIGRVLRGQRGMLFDVLVEGLERAGFGLHLEAVALGYQPKEQTLDIGSSVPVWLGWMVVPTAERGNYARASSI